MSLQPVLHELEFRLAYADCDPAGIVYYAAYYPWFERTYNEWAFLGGFPPSRMHELWGATHVTVASNCTYIVPGRLHEPFTTRMRLGRLGTTSFTMTFSIDHRETDVTYAEGAMTYVFVDRANLDDDVRPRPAPVPAGLKQVLTAAGYELGP
jgi:acyl-CoA thioester hydrolase